MLEDTARDVELRYTAPWRDRIRPLDVPYAGTRNSLFWPGQTPSALLVRLDG